MSLTLSRDASVSCQPVMDDDCHDVYDGTVTSSRLRPVAVHWWLTAAASWWAGPVSVRVLDLEGSSVKGGTMVRWYSLLSSAINTNDSTAVEYRLYYALCQFYSYLKPHNSSGDFADQIWCCLNGYNEVMLTAVVMATWVRGRELAVTRPSLVLWRAR